MCSPNTSLLGGHRSPGMTSGFRKMVVNTVEDLAPGLGIGWFIVSCGYVVLQ